jgi:hypothetical protein
MQSTPRRIPGEQGEQVVLAEFLWISWVLEDDLMVSAALERVVGV